ncbi:PTS system, fructose-specific, IIB component [Seinonella peptonophila]|uniref:PTS system, fructose-specific, IIB component n=1 Tax=Seinonella peptonophila TaxID=112248 RepID=A0A1M4ZSS1_9BACL|nr:PTS fructose transporter subunit IIB [Seinonella peptonophila]SHF21058.1 PTS system, fructose-specific, IIB component [Seinonella peptonophila]
MQKIVGVTACPAGIAHTYMAAESIEQAAKKLGYEIKMETNGASGVENRLTEKDIEEAVAVIIAADTSVEMKRFHGKPLIEVSVGEAIRKADIIMNQVKSGDIEIYQS